MRTGHFGCLLSFGFSSRPTNQPTSQPTNQAIGSKWRYWRERHGAFRMPAIVLGVSVDQPTNQRPYVGGRSLMAYGTAQHSPASSIGLANYRTFRGFDGSNREEQGYNYSAIQLRHSPASLIGLARRFLCPLAARRTTSPRAPRHHLFSILHPKTNNKSSCRPG